MSHNINKYSIEFEFEFFHEVQILIFIYSCNILLSLETLQITWEEISTTYIINYFLSLRNFKMMFQFWILSLSLYQVIFDIFFPLIFCSYKKNLFITDELDILSGFRSPIPAVRYKFELIEYRYDSRGFGNHSPWDWYKNSL